MRFWKFIKSIVLGYLIFAGIFFVCLNISHELFLADDRHEQTMTCQAESVCDGAVHGHALAAIPAQATIAILAIFLLFFVEASKSLYAVLLDRMCQYLKKWRYQGGGMHLFDFTQKLFARGILNSKIYNFVIA